MIKFKSILNEVYVKPLYVYRCSNKVDTDRARKNGFDSTFLTWTNYGYGIAFSTDSDMRANPETCVVASQRLIERRLRLYSYDPDGMSDGDKRIIALFLNNPKAVAEMKRYYKFAKDKVAKQKFVNGKAVKDKYFNTKIANPEVAIEDYGNNMMEFLSNRPYNIRYFSDIWRNLFLDCGYDGIEVESDRLLLVFNVKKLNPLIAK